jgi:hypothetical protein
VPLLIGTILWTFAASPRNIPAVNLADPFSSPSLGNHLGVYFGTAGVMVAAGYAKSAWRRMQQNRARSWPVTEGRVEMVDVGERNWWDLSANLRDGSARSARNVVALGYSYHVAGTVHSGTYKKEFEAEEDAWEFARRLKGSAITVQYDTDKPSASLLCESSIDPLGQTHPPALGRAKLNRSSGQPAAELAAFRVRLSAWRIASWIALAIGVWEGYQFVQLSNADRANLSGEAKVRLAVCLVALLVSRMCGWMSTLQRRRATQEEGLR